MDTRSIQYRRNSCVRSFAGSNLILKHNARVSRVSAGQETKYLIHAYICTSVDAILIAVNFFRSLLTLSLDNERDRWFIGAIRFDFGRR